METARVYHPSLFRQFQQCSRALDRLGRSACNLYQCVNYCNCQHKDNDVVPGFCINLECIAHIAWKEYAFIQAAYGYYFEMRANSLWFFFFFFFRSL
jgi:hypothetical protein